jgi:hypothetical protein
MMQNETKDTKPEPVAQQSQPKTVRPGRPDDWGAIHIDGVVRIFDPNTQETIVKTRT